MSIKTMDKDKKDDDVLFFSPLLSINSAESKDKTAPGDGKKAKPKCSSSCSRKKHVQISDIVEHSPPPEVETTPEKSSRCMEPTPAEVIVPDFVAEQQNRASVPAAVAVNFAATASTFFPMLRLQDSKDGTNPTPDKNNNSVNPSNDVTSAEEEEEGDGNEVEEESALIATRGSVEEARRDAAEHEAALQAMANKVDYEESETDLGDDDVITQQIDNYNYLQRQPEDDEVDLEQIIAQRRPAFDSIAQEEPILLQNESSAGYVRSVADSLQARQTRLSESIEPSNSSPAARAAEAAIARANAGIAEDPHAGGIPCDCMLKALQDIPEDEREFKIRKIQCQCALLKFADKDPDPIPDEQFRAKPSGGAPAPANNFGGANERDLSASRSSAEETTPKPRSNTEPTRAAKENIFTKPMIGVLKVTNDEVCFSVWTTPDFKMLTMEKAPLTTLKPATGWVEQDPADIIFQCFQTINKLCCRLQQQDCSLELIQGIAIVNEPNTVVAWHSNTNKALYNAILGKDTRTQTLIDEMIRRNSNDENKFKNTTGLPLSTYYSAPKLRWLMENVDEVQQASEEGRLRVGTLETWIMWHLTDGRMHLSDCTNAASTMLMNIKSLSWDPTLLKEFKIDSHSLPTICSNSEDFGRITTCRCVLVDLPVTTMIALPNSLFIGTLAMEPGQTVAHSSEDGSLTLCNTGEDCVIDKKRLATTVAYKMGRSEPTVYALVGAMPSVKHLLETFGTNPRLVPQAEDTFSRRSGGSRRSDRSDHSRTSFRRSLFRQAPPSIQEPTPVGLANALSTEASENVIRRSSARAAAAPVSDWRSSTPYDEEEVELEHETDGEPSIAGSLPPLNDDDERPSRRPSFLQRLSRQSRNSRNSQNPAGRGFFSGPFFFSAAPPDPDRRPSSELAEDEEEEELGEEEEPAEPDAAEPRSSRYSARPSARAATRQANPEERRSSVRDYEYENPQNEVPNMGQFDLGDYQSRDAGRPSPRSSRRDSSQESGRPTLRNAARDTLHDAGRDTLRPSARGTLRDADRGTLRPSGRDTLRSPRDSPRSTSRRSTARRPGRGNRSAVDSLDDLQEPVMFIPPGNGIYEPTWRPGHTGHFTGITDDTTPDDIKNAVLEARDFQTRAVVDAVDEIAPHKVEDINATGDLANDPKAMQLVANLTEVDVVRSNEKMPADYGTAILGAQPVGLAPLAPRKINELRGNPRIYHPQFNAEAERQRDRYDQWRKHLPDQKSSKGILDSIPGFSMLPLGLQQLLHGDINDDNRLLLQALVAALLLLLGFYLFRRMTRKKATEEVVERSCGCAKQKLKKLF